MKPDVVLALKDLEGGPGNICVSDGSIWSAVLSATPRERPAILEKGSGATRGTSGPNSIIPRREGEQPAPSKVSLGEKKRQQQSGI